MKYGNTSKVALSFFLTLILGACGQNQNGATGSAGRYAQNAAPGGSYYNPFLDGTNPGGATSVPDGIDEAAVEDTFGRNSNLLDMVAALEANDGDLDTFARQVGPILAMFAQLQDARVTQAMQALAQRIAYELAKIPKNATKEKKRSFIKAVGKLIRGFIGSVMAMLRR